MRLIDADALEPDADYDDGDYWAVSIAQIHNAPTIEPEPQWNNHTVACLLAELYGDTCACNYNDISEWLPEKCEMIDACPNPVGVACWEQFLKHREGQDEKANI